eukprot:TRINITY_DN8837_c0_g1_i1.p2 TRINITY_DN8837_c0_g1~~TRINITY_DN8837_c0_g1_i1.p2  ORF type:complete len:122 (-),score=16.61 TRINITY_DN8837_c0_g1_i1:133-498(-)
MSWRARLSTNMQEMRFHVCPTSASSQGTRDFLTSNWASFRMLNPRFPIFVRDATGLKASVLVRYDWNVEKRVDVEGYSKEQLETTIKELVEQGTTMDRSLESSPKDRDIVDEIDVRLKDDY